VIDIDSDRQLVIRKCSKDNGLEVSKRKLKAGIVFSCFVETNFSAPQDPSPDLGSAAPSFRNSPQIVVSMEENGSSSPSSVETNNEVGKLGVKRKVSRSTLKAIPFGETQPHTPRESAGDYTTAVSSNKTKEKQLVFIIVMFSFYFRRP